MAATPMHGRLFESRLLSPLLAAPLIGMLGGCGSPHRQPAVDRASLPPVSVQVIRVQPGDISRSITLPTFRLLPYQQATLYAKVAGYLKTLAVDKGDAVKKGEVLGEIEVPELLADRARYAAEVEAAEIEYRRLRDAERSTPDLVMPQTVDDAKAKHLVAKANLARLETLLGYTKITAPFSGVVTARWVDPGAFIPAATSSSAAQDAAVVTVMDFSKVRVQVAVPEPETPWIKEGLPAEVSVDELPGRVFNGTITRYAHALDPATKTMLTEIEIANPNGELLPGMYARVRLVLRRNRAALRVPAEALAFEKDQTSVFTIVHNQARKVPVKTGFNDGISVEITAGLRPDEPVVLIGKQALTDGQSVNPVEVK